MESIEVDWRRKKKRVKRSRNGAQRRNWFPSIYFFIFFAADFPLGRPGPPPISLSFFFVDSKQQQQQQQQQQQGNEEKKWLFSEKKTDQMRRGFVVDRLPNFTHSAPVKSRPYRVFTEFFFCERSFAHWVGIAWNSSLFFVRFFFTRNFPHFHPFFFHRLFLIPRIDLVSFDIPFWGHFLELLLGFYRVFFLFVAFYLIHGQFRSLPLWVSWILSFAGSFFFVWRNGSFETKN